MGKIIMLMGHKIGKKVMLPSSFTGSASYQHQLYQDAMAIVQCYGKPDLFITSMCNPKWEEIAGTLLDNQSPCDRPDIVAHILSSNYRPCFTISTMGVILFLVNCPH